MICYFVLWVCKKRRMNQKLSYFSRYALQMEHKKFAFLCCTLEVYLQFGVYVQQMV